MRKIDEKNKKSKLLLLLKNHWPAILIFFITLTVYIFLFDWGRAPILSSDAPDYINASKSYFESSHPNFSSRPPVYPLFLLPFIYFDILQWAVYIQLLFGSLGSVLLYLVVNKFIRIKWLSFAIALFLSLDLLAISFQPVILTESLSIFIVILYLFIHVRYWPRPWTLEKITGYITIDLLLIFLKPAFFLMPISIYLLEGVFSCLFKQKEIKVKLAYYCSLIILNLIIISSFSYINLRSHGFFGLTSISDTNIFGKSVEYGYLEGKGRPENPAIVRKVFNLYKNNDKKNDPWYIFGTLEQKGLFRVQAIKEVNRYLLKGNKFDYVKKSLALTPKILSRKREKLENFYSKPDIIRENEKLERLINSWHEVFVKISKIYYIGFWASLISLIYLIFKKRTKEIYMLSLIMAVVTYNIFILAAFSFMNLTRLRSPIEPLLILLLILPAFIFVNETVRFYTNNKIKNQNGFKEK